jgi:hypothetical protein
MAPEFKRYVTVLEVGEDLRGEVAEAWWSSWLPDRPWCSPYASNRLCSSSGTLMKA